MDPRADAEQRIIGRFDDRQVATEAASRLREATGAPVALDEPGDRTLAAASLQHREVAESFPGIGLGLFTGPMARGAVLWTAIGAVVGAALFAPLALVFDIGQWRTWQEALLFAAIGVLTGSSAGFVYGGGRQPLVEQEMRDTTADVMVAVTVTDPESTKAAEEVLVRAGALDVAHVVPGAAGPPDGRPVH